MRKRKFDFEIDKWEGFDKKVLRFYPRQSNVHGFGEEPPTTWKGVYKTYMTFAVLHYYEDDDDEGKYERPYELFSYYRDEGEGLRYLREVLSEMITEECQNEYNITPFGDGIDWEIYKDDRYVDKEGNNMYIFNMINSHSGQCYRFRLCKEEIKGFYNVLDDFLEHMLKHSVGI